MCEWSLILVALASLGPVCTTADARKIHTLGKMAKKTVTNDRYVGVLEAMAIPAELHERDGYRYASAGTAVPVHCCTPEQVALRANSTHHYADVFTEELFAPLAELAYVRVDESTAEKVFINRSKRMLLVSSDGVLAQWRAAPTFESNNSYLAGAPLVDERGRLVSVVTARRGNHYAVSSYDGSGGYFETPRPWRLLETGEGRAVYGDRTFASRDELRQYVAGLPPAVVGVGSEPEPVLHSGPSPRLALVAHNGRQLSYHYLGASVITTDVQYL